MCMYTPEKLQMFIPGFKLLLLLTVYFLDVEKLLNSKPYILIYIRYISHIA